MKPATTLAAVAVVFGILAALPIVASTNQDPTPQDLTDQPAAVSPVVEFGHPDILSGTSNHVMVPKEVTIFKGGTVTFRTNGGGHGIAIYPVSKNTRREDIADDLCQDRPADCDPMIPAPRCKRTIIDRDDRLVIAIEAGGPADRIDYEPGQVLSVGTGAFLIGTAETGTPPVRTPGTRVRVRFEEDGRYLVICMNRPHAVNECMFGFVNVTTPPR